MVYVCFCTSSIHGDVAQFGRALASRRWSLGARTCTLVTAKDTTVDETGEGGKSREISRGRGFKSLHPVNFLTEIVMYKNTELYGVVV